MNQPPESSPKAIFAEFLAHDSEVSADRFAALLRRHPQFAGRLEELYHDWQQQSGEEAARYDVTRSMAPAQGDASTGSETRKDHGTDFRGATFPYQHDRYDIQGELGKGGMGVVLRVWDRNLHRPLAMKQILKQDDSSASGPSIKAARFLEEAYCAAELEHPGVAPVHEMGEDEQGRPYFTMRLVAGDDLRTVFTKIWEGKQGWTLTRALGILIRVCDTIAYAHSKRIIHRDLKPSNIMVGAFGETYVMDWGLAKRLSEPAVEEMENVEPRETPVPDGSTWGSTPHLPTLQGTIVGTPYYMPPEQAAGRVDQLDERSDVYSLGTILYTLLARRPPYAGEEGASEILSRAIAGPPKSLNELPNRVPAELVAICEKAMARRPGDRYPTMQAFGEDLQAYLENRVVQAHCTGAWAEARKWVTRNRWFAAATLTAVVFAIAGLFSVIAVQNHKNSELEEMAANLDRENHQKTSALDRESRALQDRTEALGVANRNLRQAQGLYLAARADELKTKNPGLALAMGVESAHLHPSDLANNALLSALDQNREILTFHEHQDAVRSARFSPQGDRIVTA